jgi:hypothetical protein
VKAFNQNWYWDWAEKVTLKDSQCGIDAFQTDIYNNIYCAVDYDDSIFFPDTSFHHLTYGQTTKNWTIAKYTPDGNFEKAIDIYTLPGENIWNLKLVTDKDLNLYVASEFMVRVFIQDSIINHGIGPNIGAPDVFLVKLDSDFNVLWSKLIFGPYQDWCNGFTISKDNYIYLLSEHAGNNSLNEQVYYLGQDSTSLGSSLQSVLKIDLDGNIIWRKEIRRLNVGDLSGDMLFIGDDGYIYCWGRTSSSFVVDGDTIIHPHTSDYYNIPFQVSFDENGNVNEAQILDWSVSFLDIKINDKSDVYFSAIVWDTLSIGQNTLVVPEDSSGYVICRADKTFTPLWYEFIKTGQNQQNLSFRLNLDEDNLLFSTPFNKTLHLGDTIFSVGTRPEVITGLFSPDGQLMQTIITQSDYGVLSHHLVLDNCRNVIISGSFQGQANFGEDTLFSYSTLNYDGFMAHLMRLPKPTFYLGNDTIVCDSTVLQGPDGYEIYNWNNGLSFESLLPVTQTGEYNLAVANSNYCWMWDTIYIEVTDSPILDLGKDTTIKLKDTLTFTLPSTYDSYLWSTGDTTNSISISGEILGTGVQIIWAEATHEECSARDTVVITVIDDYGIGEPNLSDMIVFPNPSSGLYNISLKENIETIEIINLKGYPIFKSSSPLKDQKKFRLDISKEQAGIYFVKIKTQTRASVFKLVKF